LGKGETPSPFILLRIIFNETIGSEPAEENARKLVENASNIWAQAAINFEVREINNLKRSDEEIGILYRPHNCHCS